MASFSPWIRKALSPVTGWTNLLAPACVICLAFTFAFSLIEFEQPESVVISQAA
jgi:hypothetical protein